MAEQESNRSEDATPYKLEQARKRGKVVRSNEVGFSAMVAAVLLYSWNSGPEFIRNIATILREVLADGLGLHPDRGAMIALATRHGLRLLNTCVPLFLIILGVALAVGTAQVGFLFAPAAAIPDWQRLNISENFKRLFSSQSIIEAAKSTVKVSAYGLATYLVVRDAFYSATGGPMLLGTLGSEIRRAVVRLLGFYACIALLFAAVDFYLARRKFSRDMRMSRRELTQEHKQREGDPRIKSRRRQLQREMLARSQSLGAVKGANLVVTNPTHYAVALRYRDADNAPIIVAKGAGENAARIKRIAALYGIRTIEEKRLARRLFRTGIVDCEIPVNLYRDVAKLYFNNKISK